MSVGRPKLPNEIKRQQIGVRTSPSLKKQLEDAALKNGRSVAQEAEYRLSISFRDDELRLMIRDEIAAAVSSIIVGKS